MTDQTPVPAQPTPTAEPVPVNVEPEELKVPRSRITGGISDTLTLAESLRLFKKLDKEHWTPRPGRYYASMLMQCFRKRYYEAMNERAIAKAKSSGTPLVLPFPPEPSPDWSDFTPGLAEPGNALERHLTAIWRRVYGYEGVVLQDIRLTNEVVLQQDAEGTPTESIALVAKTDPMFVGDNFEVLELNELKSVKYQFPKKLQQWVEGSGGIREFPLSILGIQTPDKTEGAVNINNAVQLAIEAKILTDRGLAPRKTKLSYILSYNWDDHLVALFSPADIELLYNVGEWWAIEHHEHLKKDTPPAPNFFMGWECSGCMFRGNCDKRNAQTGEKRAAHPMMKGLNERLRVANGVPATVAAPA